MSTVYKLYIADEVCKSITTPELFVTTLITESSSTESKFNDIVVVGGVLGFTVSCNSFHFIDSIALVYYQLKWKRNAKQSR